MSQNGKMEVIHFIVMSASSTIKAREITKIAMFYAL